MEPSRVQMSPEEILALENPYFELQAYVGTTKHMGGLQATKEMIELCHIDRDSYVLDLGCGAGATPAYLAKQVGCGVVGVDIREQMIALATERARRDAVIDRVELRVADAQDLPFEDGCFDAVMVESVTSFIEHKPTAVKEYVRVAKPGGYVGLNEDTWLKEAPPAELMAYAAHTWGGTTPETAGGWKNLLEAAGLESITARTYELKAGRESSQVQRYHFVDMWRMGLRSLRLYLTSAAFRQYMKARMPMPKGLWQYLGYGIYVGAKAGT
jgi:arsenite methyltransferase